MNASYSLIPMGRLIIQKNSLPKKVYTFVLFQRRSSPFRMLGNCISYLSFTTNSLPHSRLKTRIFSISHCFWGAGIWEQLIQVALGQCFSWGCSQDVSWGCRFLKSWIGVQHLLPRRLTHMGVDWMLQFLTGCWQDVSAPHHLGLSIGLLTTWHLTSPRLNVMQTRQKSQCLL